MKPKGNINENWRVSNENDKISEYAFEEVTEDEFNCVLPSSPNWYCNNILHSYNGYFAFGGKNACFIFDLKKKPPICTWSMVGATFSIRVTAVSLLSTFEDPSKEPDMLAFSAEDGHLKVVNIANKTTVTEHKKHMAKITSISWTHVNKTTIISGDEKGVILVWDFVNKICNVWTPLQTMLTYISSSPHSADIAAFGYMNGNIILGDTKKLNTLHTFKNHINEVCHISWHPFEVDQFVSIAKDKTLRIYSTTDKILQKSFTTPRNIGSRNNSNKHAQQTSKPYFTVLWLDNDRIVSSFPTGELLSWDINSGKWKAITNGHNRIIFCLRKDDLTNQLISVSMDRMILIHKKSNLKVAQRIPTFGGFVYSLSSVPQDPHRFAVGVGDNTIRVWSTGDQADPYNSASIWHSIKTKVTVIQYHPTKEGIIGFGTEDGHVGCYSSITQKSDVSTSYHKKTVYALEWGPCSCSKEEQEDEKVKVNCLYSVGGEGMILMHKLGAFNQKAVDIGALIKKHNHITSPPSRSEIKWHQSYQFVAIGNEDGTIDVFSATHLTLLGHIQAHKKIINSIDWHHDFTGDLSDCSFWIASGSNEETVCVYDARSICLQEKSSIKAITVDTPYQTLTGHSSRITKVKWSPHAIGVLASSSYDGSIQVWDVKKNEGLGNYRGHLGRVHCVAWSYVSSDVLLSGGEDFCLHRWRYTETKDKMPPSSKSKQSKTRKKKKKDAPEKDGESKKELIQTDEKLPEESSKPATLEEASNQQPSQKASQERTTVKDYSSVNGVLSEDGVEFVEQLDGKHRGKKPKVSLLKLSSIADSKKKELMQEDCINLATYLKAESTKLGSGCEKAGLTPGSEEHVNLGLYTDRKGVFTMLSTESQNHKESGSIDKYNHLQIWQNSIPAAIEHAVKNKCLNDSLVALSPLGGYDLWLSTCMKYAEQLEERSNFSMAANYYMMSGDFNRVINMFKANNFIKEALTFAKSHLPKGDPTLTELYLLWAKRLSNENSYENAAECYLACGHTDDAITMLSKRNDANAIMTALKVATIYEMTEKCDQLSTKAVKALLQEQRWSTCFELINERPDLPMINKIQLVVGEILLEYVDRKQFLTLFLEDTDNHQTHRCFSKVSSEDSSRKSSTDDISILTYMANLLESEFGITQNNVLSIEEAPKLQILKSNRKPNDLLYDLITCFVSSLIHLLNKDVTTALKELLVGFDLLAGHGFQIILEPIYNTLFPRNQVSFSGIVKNYGNADESQDLNSLMTNFMAFELQGLLYSTLWKTQDQTCDENENLLRNIKEKYNDENISSILHHSSSILLGAIHFHYFNLEDQMQSIKERNMELEIKKRLKEHLASKQNAKKPVKINRNKRLSVEEEVREFLGEIVDNVVRSFPTEEELKKTALEEEMNHVTDALDKIPQYFKDFKFPKVADSLNVMLLICCQHAHVNKNIVTFCKELLKWMDNQNVEHKSKYVEQMVRNKVLKLSEN